MASDPVRSRPEVSIIVPARNEEACLGACLESLVRQSGLSFEILVVDDGSADRTRQVALSFPGVRVIDPPPLPSGWTGKNNAVAAGTRQARGKWLLFTDADTVHLPGSLASSIAEANEHQAALLSYSPEQLVKGFWEGTVMAVIFAELASSYRPAEVSNPASSVAAANGQYLLLSREAYDAVGGHTAIAGSLVEDVALARAVKGAGRRIFFRYGGDRVRTRMYRSFAQLREGWTKNLALLFPRPLSLAFLRIVEFALMLTGVAFAAKAARLGARVWASLAAIATLALYVLFLERIRKAHFSWRTNLSAIFGLPLFSYLLLHSRLCYEKATVMWKGRVYQVDASLAAGLVISPPPFPARACRTEGGATETQGQP